MGEVSLKRLTDLNPTAVVGRDINSVDLLKRDPVSSSLGCDVEGFAPAKPDLSHTPTSRRGAIRRFSTKPTRPCFIKIRRLRRFARRFFKKHFTALPPDHPVNAPFLERVLWWLPLTNYPAARREELWQLALEMVYELDEENFDIKSFIKEETYPEYKDSRCINARSDKCKLLLGPYFKAIEDVAYENPHFIKHVPVKDRAEYIYQRLYTPDGQYVASDYTSFEAHFTPEMMHAIEFEFYSYMSDPLGNNIFLYVCYQVLAGRNTVRFKSFTIWIWGIRMSGEMNTSLGNGIANLVIMYFVLTGAGCTRIVGVVEGDDGLFTFVGSLPTQTMFNTLGFDIKLEVHSSLSSASFCGLVFDLEDRVNVTDPRQVLINLGWVGRKYNFANNKTRMVLLRAKGYSLAYTYPRCPILSSLARYVLRVTRSYDIRDYVNNSRNLNQWERSWYQEAMAYGSAHGFANDPIGQNTRDLVWKLYGIDDQQQIKIEKYFDSLNELVHLSHPLFDEILPPVSHHVFVHYVRDVRKGDHSYRTDLGDKPGAPIYDAAEKLITAGADLYGERAYSDLSRSRRSRAQQFVTS